MRLNKAWYCLLCEPRIVAGEKQQTLADVSSDLAGQAIDQSGTSLN